MKAKVYFKAIAQSAAAKGWTMQEFYLYHHIFGAPRWAQLIAAEAFGVTRLVTQRGFPTRRGRYKQPGP